jgi:hypothetical protein
VIAGVLAKWYGGGMLPLSLSQTHGITVVVGLPPKELLLEVIAQLALLRSVQVVVGGNHFDVYKLARIIRRRTLLLDQTLGQIHQARPFTCYQMLKLLADISPDTPVVVSDMLTTFYDENLSDEESVRLVSLAIGHLRRLGQIVPVLVMINFPPPVMNARAVLVKLLQDSADQVFIHEPPIAPVQPTLL